MADIGIGIIGAGRVATYHLQALAKTPEASVIATLRRRAGASVRNRGRL